MIRLIEDEISKILHAGLKLYGGDNKLVSSVLNVDETRATRFANMLATKPPVIRRGYPRQPTELPCICIMLAGEEESQSGLGDHNDEPIQAFTKEDTVYVPLQIIDSIPTLMVDLVPIVNVNRIYDPITEDEVVDFIVTDPSRGKIQIFDMSGLEEGKTLAIEFSHMNTISAFIESKYQLNYRVEIWTNNGDFTVELYHVVKAMLLQGRQHLVNAGLVKQSIRGTDFQPVPSFFPEFVYRRGISLTGESLVSIPDIGNFDHIISGITIKPEYKE